MNRVAWTEEIGRAYDEAMVPVIQGPIIRWNDLWQLSISAQRRLMDLPPLPLFFGHQLAERTTTEPTERLDDDTPTR